MTVLSTVLRMNAEIRRMARSSLPDPSPLEIDELVERVSELLKLIGAEIIPLGQDRDVPNLIKVKLTLALLTEELRNFLVEKALI